MAAAPDIAQELLEEFLRGNVLVFVGEGINRGCLPLSTDLAKKLARESGYPDGEPLDFPSVATSYEYKSNRHRLVEWLREQLSLPTAQPSTAHYFLAQLKPQTIVTICYDRLLRQAFEEDGIRLAAVVRDQDVPYTDQQKTLLVSMWGSLDQPSSLVITKDDHRRLIGRRDSLTDFLRAELARRTWLFLGVELQNDWLQWLYDDVRQGLDEHARRSYAFGTGASDSTRQWWEVHGVTVSDIPLDTFLAQFAALVASGRRRLLEAKQQAAVPLELPASPYRGLDFYREEDSYLFFGRDEEIARLSMLIHAHRLVLLYGSSGAGKTSLLQAGIVPRLKQGDPAFSIIIVRALSDLRVSVRNAIARRLDPQLLMPDGKLTDVLAAYVRSHGATLLIVDQFEEFFSQVEESMRQAIMGELAEVYDSYGLPVKIVLSFREDYLACLGELETRIPEIMNVRFRLTPLEPNAARRAISGPVELLGKRYEPALVDRLVQDLTGQGIMPPQIQIVCSRLYDELLASGEAEITVALYDGLGGAAGILGAYLVHELGSLHGQQDLARRILAELVDLDNKRRVVSLDELARALGKPVLQLEEILSRLVNRRLVRPLDLEESAATGYELTHDYLAPLVVGWLDEEAVERKRIYELVAQDVRRWRDYGMPITRSALDRIRRQWSRLQMTAPEHMVILQSAVEQGHDLAWWMAEFGDEPGAHGALEELLRAPTEDKRLHAATAWRYVPSRDAGAALLAGVALADPATRVRREAVISLMECDGPHAVERLMTADAPSYGRRVEALAYLWDESGEPKRLSKRLRARIALTLAHIRLRQSGRLLIFYSLVGLIAGVLLGMVVTVAGALLDSSFFRTSIKDALTYYLFAAGYIAFLVPMMMLALTATDALVKHPRRRLLVFASGLELGLIMSIAFSVAQVWGYLRGEPYDAVVAGLVVGMAIGTVLAELVYRRRLTGRMPALRTNLLVAVGAGLLAGFLAAFFPNRYGDPGYLAVWLSGVAFVVVLFVAAIALTIRFADRLLADFMIPIDPTGGN